MQKGGDKDARKIHKKSRLALKVTLIVGVVIFCKLIVHWLGWEIISLNPLLSGIVAANVFLMGFLQSDSTEDVSLKPLDDLIDKLTKAI